MAYAAGPSSVPNAFEGFYIAAGGSYGSSSTRSSSLFNSGSGTNGNGFSFGFGVENPLLQGGSFVGAGGYNLTFGGLLVGLELDGRWGQESTGSSSAGPTPAAITNVNDIAFHVSGRIGGFIGDTLIFGKIGAGITHFKDSYFVDTRSISVSSCNFVPVVPVCQTQFPGGTGSATVEKWIPSLILGVGIERNMGRFFIRVSGEAEMLASNGIGFSTTLPGGSTFGGGSGVGDAFWTARATAMLGVRF